MIMKDTEKSLPPYAATALALTVTDWNRLGLDTYDENLNEEELIDILVERVTSLLLIRIVAYILSRGADEYFDAPAFADLSTSTICRTVLIEEKPWTEYAPELTDEFLQQLKNFVRTIIVGYKGTPYHCKEHAFHVVLSVNKLTDLMIQTNPTTTKTFGLRYDAMAQMALLLAALVHDVEHTGVPNRQLVAENDPLAILYNDQSVAEQRSLYIAFETLLKNENRLFLTTLFPFQNGKLDSIEYRRFRKMVIDLVLSTDIASPERSQLTKSKWKEAFGETFESIQRKLKQELNDTVNAPVDEDESVSASETPESSVNDGEEGGYTATAQNRRSVGNDLRKYLSSSDLGYENPDELDGVIVSSSTRHSVRNLSFKIENMPRSPPKAVMAADNKSTASSSGESFSERERFRRGGRRRSHAHSMPMGRRNSVQQLLQSDDYVKAKFQRRMSSYSSAKVTNTAVRPEAFRKRLGLRRSMDLGGEEIEFYNSANSIASTTHEPCRDDEPDELRAAVVMETIITAADVAHNLQGWDQMVIWSGRLYLELRKAYIEERGMDPETRWYENQIGFLESYLLPLARRLEDTGVFGDELGQLFATIVEANRDQWIQEGQDVTEAIVEKGAEEFIIGR
jgi:3'5'-cyclic nucleotide phosphodiesterase